MFARQNNFEAIMTLDDDFNHLQILNGAPPKIIWIRAKNSPTKILAELVEQRKLDIYNFLLDNKLDCLEILT
jgi:predicted nuclease of predicted toxin-antitoxin system